MSSSNKNEQKFFLERIYENFFIGKTFEKSYIAAVTVTTSAIATALAENTLFLFFFYVLNFL